MVLPVRIGLTTSPCITLIVFASAVSRVTSLIILEWFDQDLHPSSVSSELKQVC